MKFHARMKNFQTLHWFLWSLSTQGKGQWLWATCTAPTRRSSRPLSHHSSVGPAVLLNNLPILALKRYQYLCSKSLTKYTKRERLSIKHVWKRKKKNVPATRSKHCHDGLFLILAQIACLITDQAQITWLLTPMKKAQLTLLQRYKIWHLLSILRSGCEECSKWKMNWCWVSQMSVEAFFQSHSIISLRHLFLNHDVHQLLTPIKPHYIPKQRTHSMSTKTCLKRAHTLHKVNFRTHVEFPALSDWLQQPVRN